MTSNQTESVAERPLQEAFIHDHFTFKMLQRDGDIALFEKRHPEHSSPSWEVVVVQHRPAAIIFGNECPAHEGMPTSSTWGMYGWTATTLDSAKTTFNEWITDRQQCHLRIKGVVKDASERIRCLFVPSAVP